MTSESAPDRSRRQACRVCGCTERNACMTEDGPCFWLGDPDRDALCSACAAAADHTVSMTIDWSAAAHDDVATCACGWSHREARGPSGLMERAARLDAAIRAHWQAVVAEAAR